MVQFLITALVAALILYLIFWVMGYLGVPDPIRKVVTVVVVVLVCIWLISMLAGYAQFPAYQGFNRVR